MFKNSRTIEALGVNDLKFIIIGIPLVAFLVPILFLDKSLDVGLLGYLPKFLVSLYYTTLYWLSIRYLFIVLRKKYPSQKDTSKRIGYSALGIFISFVLINLSCYTITPLFIDSKYLVSPLNFDLLVGSLTTIIICVLVYESLFLYDRWKRTLVEAERLRSQNIQSQLEGLKQQINPHFLFNSLNTLSYLIPEDQDRAVKFVHKLSKVYRYFLEIQEQKLIPVSEELEFIHAYTFLVKERFGENLLITIDIPKEEREMSIIPLSLQILFENAIKHNVISKTNPLHIKVYVDEKSEYLCVSNNLQPKINSEHSTKIGLNNIKSRYQYFSKQPVQVHKNDDAFIVALPLIPVAIAV